MALTEKQIAQVKGMLERGDKQHDIAAYFGVNGGRVAEVATGHTGPEVPAVREGLPPQGNPVEHARKALDQAILLLDHARDMLRNA